MNIREIDGRTWETPLTHQPLLTVGDARLTLKHYRGTYYYEGTGGYEFYKTNYWLPVIALQRKQGRSWKTWMVDDPLHWDGMAEAVAELPDGRILIAGLGLGLMLHHMAQSPRFTKIVVIEQSQDVINLIRPTLPKDDRVTIVCADFYRYIHDLQNCAPQFDGVLWDLAVGTPEDTIGPMLSARAAVAAFLGVPLVQFGVRRRKMKKDLEMSDADVHAFVSARRHGVKDQADRARIDRIRTLFDERQAKETV